MPRARPRHRGRPPSPGARRPVARGFPVPPARPRQEPLGHPTSYDAAIAVRGQPEQDGAGDLPAPPPTGPARSPPQGRPPRRRPLRGAHVVGSHTAGVRTLPGPGERGGDEREPSLAALRVRETRSMDGRRLHLDTRSAVPARARRGDLSLGHGRHEQAPGLARRSRGPPRAGKPAHRAQWSARYRQHQPASPPTAASPEGAGALCPVLVLEDGEELLLGLVEHDQVGPDLLRRFSSSCSVSPPRSASPRTRPGPPARRAGSRPAPSSEDLPLPGPPARVTTGASPRAGRAPGPTGARGRAQTPASRSR